MSKMAIYCGIANNLQELLDSIDMENSAEIAEAAIIRKRLRELKNRDSAYLDRREIIRKSLMDVNALIKAEGEPKL